MCSDNINSGSTYVGSEITIWRSEELYKVLFHELIHYFKLDYRHNADQYKEIDKLVVGYEYYIHDVPEDKYGFDKTAFEKELGDFVVELLYYGLERDKLGFIDDQENRTDHPFESNS